jgi:hypothetical protein
MSLDENCRAGIHYGFKSRQKFGRDIHFRNVLMAFFIVINLCDSRDGDLTYLEYDAAGRDERASRPSQTPRHGESGFYK